MTDVVDKRFFRGRGRGRPQARQLHERTSRFCSFLKARILCEQTRKPGRRGARRTVLRHIGGIVELGVASFGHRVKLLDAVAALRSDAGGKAPSVDAATASSAPSARPEDSAERRQVTVMFSDLVGSTARMDPEDLREVKESVPVVSPI